jgi:hypothetical protein
MKQDDLIGWLTSNCPVFVSLLNQNAKINLSSGINAYIGQGSEDEIKAGKINFLTIESLLSELITYSSEKEVADSYRRVLSNVSTEQTLSEIFCEIALCVKVGSYSGSIILRPITSKGTHSDCKFFINGSEIYGEVKRYQDPWPHIVRIGEKDNPQIPFSRSLFKSEEYKKPFGVARPRHMDVQSKLENVNRQFPDDTRNILFVFLPSLGEPRDYLVQSMLGQNNFKREEKNFALEKDGLFAKETWKIISACCLTRVNPESKAFFPVVLKNPNAKMPIEDEIIEKLKTA